jgi:hypothetical protein|tara:strand:- start:218 stop:460 length:243 start_codon:yes stop_codon:yes gene_type:complete
LFKLKPQRATERATDKQIGGTHYKSYSIQPIEFIVANKLDFIQGNIIKYALRDKDGENPDEKWNKIIHYCELAKELKNKK